MIRQCAGGLPGDVGNAGRGTAHAARRRYMLEDIRTIVEVDVASFDSSLLADRVSGSKGGYQGQVVAQPVVEGQVRSGFPGILGKRA